MRKIYDSFIQCDESLAAVLTSVRLKIDSSIAAFSTKLAGFETSMLDQSK
jgi:hypothetical protein